MSATGRRASSRLSRRVALGGMGAGALGLSPLPGAGARAATPGSIASHQIVGAWRIVPDPPGPPLVFILYHADGTLIFSTPISSPAEPGASFTVTYDTPAYGVWEAIDTRSVALSASLIETDEAGNALGTLNFHGTLQLDEAGDAYVYHGVVEVVDPNGGLVATQPVSTRATRMRVDRAKAAAATPVAGTPRA
jgi:hypothetical protein